MILQDPPRDPDVGTLAASGRNESGGQGKAR
jgi:hypothetical protein